MGRFLLSLFILICVPVEAKRFELLDGKSAYQILGVNQNADHETIESAVRDLVFTSENPEHIRAAYRYLGTPLTRARYDEWLLSHHPVAVLTQPLSKMRGIMIGIFAATIAYYVEREKNTNGEMFDPALVVLSHSLFRVHALSPREIYAAVAVHGFTPIDSYADEVRFALVAGAVAELESRLQGDEVEEALFFLDQVEKLISHHAASPGVTIPAAQAILEFRARQTCNERLASGGLWRDRGPNVE